MSQKDTEILMTTVGRIVQDALRASAIEAAALSETAPGPGTALVAARRVSAVLDLPAEEAE